MLQPHILYITITLIFFMHLLQLQNAITYNNYIKSKTIFLTYLPTHNTVAVIIITDKLSLYKNGKDNIIYSLYDMRDAISVMCSKKKKIELIKLMYQNIVYICILIHSYIICSRNPCTWTVVYYAVKATGTITLNYTKLLPRTRTY